MLNTIYRKPKFPRVPFSYPSVLASEALNTILVHEEVADASSLAKAKKGPVHVSLGEWEVDELQICEMGSKGPEGEYVAVARCPLE